MIRTSSVARDFKKLGIPAKIVFANNVSQLMTTNAAKFNNPDVAITALNGLITALSGAAQAAEGGDHQKIVAMHTAEKKLETALETEADFVDRIANGDVPTILLSGFKATVSQTQPSVAPSVVTGIKITSSQQPGAIHVESDPNNSVWAYIYLVSTTANAISLDGGQFNFQKNPAVISFITDTHRKVDFTGLPSGQSLFLTIIALNTAGIGPANAPISFRTL